MTRERIVEAARRVCEERGVERLTMRRVATAARITAPAIYRHFENKDDLFARLVGDANERMARFLERGAQGESAAQRLRLTIDALIDFALEDPTSYDVLFSSRGRRDPELQPFARRSANFRLWLERIEECREVGVLDPGHDAMEVAITLWAVLNGLLGLHFQGRFAGSEETLRELCRGGLRQVVEGIGGPACGELW